MTTKEITDLFGITDILYLPEAISRILFGDAEARNRVYEKLIQLNNGDFSRDWFQDIYEAELSQLCRALNITFSAETFERQLKLFNP